MPSQDKETSALKPGDHLGSYKITSQIGKGGMGVVYQAYDESLERPLAVKVISRELVSQKEFIERFRREARSAAALSHPNIVHVYSIGEEGGHHYYAMEYVEGKSLDDLLQEKEKIPPQEAIGYILQTTKGLAAALKKGIVHRDIKPSNLLVTPDGSVKITDFGLSKLIKIDQGHPTLTGSGTVVGTPSYIAPEQGKGETIDHRADMYALGATLYHLVTGKLPFEGETPLQVMLKHITEPLPKPSSINPQVPAKVSQVICRMMEKDPAQRYGTYEELIAVLEGIYERPRVYVNLLPRLIAVGVDTLICLAVSAVIAGFLTAISSFLPGTPPTEVFNKTFALGPVIIYFIYYLKTHVSLGQTIGKRWMNLQVLSDKGGFPQLHQIMVRFSLSLFFPLLTSISEQASRSGIKILITGDSIIDLLAAGFLLAHFVALFNRRHKTLADIVSKTVVVYKI